ncbi:MAG: hypothetical protein SVW57_14520 [Thermodesulfobacteriota bacterium]|nr:hypothetical protein [Thermodesulfobacteriota bacterium]
MSGGSYEYLCYKIEEATRKLRQSKNPLRRAFGEKLQLFATAMHDIEWVDSGDYGTGEDEKAIKLALGENSDALTLKEVLESAREIKEQLIKYGA